MIKDGEINKTLAYTIIGLLVLVFICLVGSAVILILRSNNSVVTVNTTAPPRKIQAHYGDFTIPGTGYIDGRDVNADPPLTIMYVSIFNKEKTERICSVDHGTLVELLDYDYQESRFKVKSDRCEGWLTDWFINSQTYPPVGEKIWDN